ncbi:hypothetical protein CC86DRAFT_463825 [Ophiobolus disseminans]|uniref:Guanine nucleotide-binding protein-like protein alpha-3 subunit n=1 Tax=Ophiobolus disseminans TaxID=1469910 RepID=A0A6A7AB59_9PLEO|nr:hypothetical protein CC86DRAFT_463825 [Ophiobolus disseminans]
MADPHTDEKGVYAILGAIATNRDRLRHGINTLRQIHNHWKGNNATSINLIAQLTSLKSNLGQMQDWLDHAMADMHPQLLSDLNFLMTSCGLLTQHLDALVDRLQQPNDDAYDYAARLKYAVGSRSMERLREVACAQTEAVALLFAACQCHATAQRKILLHKSRQIRSRDAKSLKMLTRSSKVNGACIKALSQASGVIQWLKYLVYFRLLRREPEHVPNEEDYDIAAAAMRSDAIDRALQDDANTLRREIKLVMAGSPLSGKELVVHQMKALYAGEFYTVEERKALRSDVRSRVRVLVHAMIHLLKDTGITLPNHLNEQFAVLLNEVETVDTQSITPAGLHAVEEIWACSQFATLYTQNFEIVFPPCAPYFVQEIRRIANADYIPSEADIARLVLRPGNAKEVRFKWDELDIHLFNLYGYRSFNFNKRWFHQFEGATALVYTVDISEYDCPYYGQLPDSHLISEIMSFESWATHRSFAGSSVILLLNNFGRFRSKLKHTPLEKFFEDYVADANDPETSARQYVLDRFKNVNRHGLSIYSFWVDLELGDNSQLYGAIKRTIQHIQQRKAKEKAWDLNSQVTDSDRRSVTRSAGRLIPSEEGRDR